MVQDVIVNYGMHEIIFDFKTFEMLYEGRSFNCGIWGLQSAL